MPSFSLPEGYRRVPYQTGGTVKRGQAYDRYGKPLRSPVTGGSVRARPGQEKRFEAVYGGGGTSSLKGQLWGLG